MKVAIIGAGVSGLLAAHRLAAWDDVTIFEAGSSLGGHVHTVDIVVGGRRLAIDTGFIVFNERHYPLFTALLGELGVGSRPTPMSFSVRSDRSGLEYSSASLQGLFAQRRNLVRPTHWRLLAEISRFLRRASRESLPDDRVTVAEYALAHGYSQAFLDEYLVPLGAALWSAPPGRFRGFSMRFVLEFLDNHAMLQLSGQPEWRVVDGGSRRYVEALASRFRGTVHLGRPIRSVARLADCVTLTDDSGAAARFDHVILACHADQALRLLADPSPAEREILGAFPYQRNDVVLHTDPSVLPRSRRAWASWNYHVPAHECDAVSVTYNMNRLQGLPTDDVVNVTLNDAGSIDPSRVLGRWTFHHPVFEPGRDAMQRRHAELIDRRRTSYCGAYWGFGFHEDGVRSALAVTGAMRRKTAA